MVFRRIRKQVRRVKRTKWYGKRYMGRNPATTLRNITSDLAKVKRAINAEYKFHDRNDLSITPFAENATDNWSIQPLNRLGQGTGGSGERLGSQVKFTSLQLRMKLQKTGSATKNAVRTRFLIFIDKEPLVSGLGNSPVPTALLQGGALNGVCNFYGQDTIRQRRFRILYDKIHMVDTDDPEKFIKLYFKLNMHTGWALASTAGTDITNNALYIAWIQDDTVNGAVSITMDTRMKYVDN